MKKRTFNIEIFFDKNYMKCPDIQLVANDYNSVEFNFIFDREEGHKVFKLKKPDGKIWVKEIEDNKIVLVDTDENGKLTSLIEQPEKYEFEICLYDENSKLTASSTGHFRVRSEVVNVDNDTISKASELQILTQLIGQVDSVIENTNKTADYAKEQGDYAKEQAENIINASEEANNIISVFKNNINQYTQDFDNNVKKQTKDFNDNADNKINTYNENASNKLNDYNTNHANKLSEYNNNHDNKLSLFNSNYEEKKTLFDNNYQEKTELFNQNASSYQEKIEDNANKIKDVSNRLDLVKNDLYEIATETGDFIHLENSTSSEFKEIFIDGVIEQKTTKGNNLFDDSTVTSTIRGTFTDKILVTEALSDNYSNSGIVFPSLILNAGTYYISAKVKLVSGTANFNKMLMSNTVTTNITRPQLTNEYQTYVSSVTLTEDTSVTSLAIQLLTNNNNAVLNATDFMISRENVEYEPYTGGEPSPSPGYQQKVEIIEETFDLVSCNKNGIVNSDTVQSEEGIVSTDYEPYQESRLSITLPENEFVGKFNDTVKDRLRLAFDEKDGTYHLYLNKRIGKNVLDGHENWYIASLTSDFVEFNASVLNPSAYTGYAYAVSKYFSNNSNNRVLTANKIVSIRFPIIYHVNTIDDIKNWLSEHPMEVYYQLAEPYSLDLGSVDMPSAYYPVTNIYTTCPLQPKIEVSYYKEKTLENYVTFDDTAKVNKSGVVKLGVYGTNISEEGLLRSEVFDNGTYESQDSESFVSKGTLENIKDNYVSSSKPIKDINSSLDILIPKNKVKTEEDFIQIKDALPYKMFDLKIDGNFKQNTTKGYQLLQYPYQDTTKTVNGITFTDNGNGTITIDGTATEIASFSLLGSPIEANQKLIQGNYLSGGFNSNIVVRALNRSTEGYSYLGISSGNVVELDLSVHQTGYIEILISKGAIVNNLTIKPMLTNTLAAEYEPYTGGKPSPNSNYQQKIEVMENDISITNCNKNLIPENINKENGYLDNNGVIYVSTPNNEKTIDYLKVKENTVYTFSLIETNDDTSNGYWFGIGAYSGESESDFISMPFRKGSDKNSVTFTTPDKTKYIRVSGRYFAGATKMQLEKNEQATQYEQHLKKQADVNIPQNEFAAKFSNDIKDNFIYSSSNKHIYLEKNIGKIVLDGSEEGWIYDSDYNYFRNPNYVYNRIPKANQYQFCTHFQVKNVWLDFRDGNEDGLFFLQPDLYKICLRNAECKTVDELKAFLSQNNVEVYYQLAESYIVDLGEYDLVTFEGINNIEILSNLEPSGLEITYALDIKKYIDDRTETR